ncbi:MAG TPA: hypothetical protein VNI52_09095 [Sphingobacteriaceae bacterium]|nr:hypothetical protein [Sphingobacteriaceae bacterium]
MKNTNQPGQEKPQDGSQGGTTSDRAFKSTKENLKQRGVSNSGGQMSYQTDNKQATVNKGNVNSDVQGKKQAPKKESQSSPKKK